MYIEFLQGNNEQVIKDAAIVPGGLVQTYLFRPPYHMEPHGSKENGLNWADGNIHYDQLLTILREAAAPYDQIYARVYDKCLLLYDILRRPIHDYELQCPDPMELKSDVHCVLPCHAFPNMRCAARNASAMHNCPGYHITHKSYMKCPINHGRHTEQFASGVPKPNTYVPKP